MARRGNQTRRSRKNCQTPNSAEGKQAAPGNDSPESPPRRQSRRRRLGFGLFTAALAVLLTGAALEVAFRLAGSGVRMSVLVPHPSADEDRLLSNPRFTWQFFGPERARDFTPFSAGMQKPEGVIRIVVLGGSAAQGDPHPEFGLDRALEVMLRECYPDRQFEVINAAITAVNSHVMLRVARACSRLEPDLFVIYMGNNEVVGPYGAGSVFSSAPRHRWAIAPDLAWRRSRVGQFVEGRHRERVAKGRDRAWRGMELFLDYQVRADDPELETVYRHFEANLRDIFAVARDAGAGVILSTVPVNLKDCAPFASVHRPGLSSEERARWDAAMERGVTGEEVGKMAAALAAYKEAAQVDDTYADLSFRMARCHLALGDTASALAAYERARDLDTLRFRADTRINRILRRLGKDHEEVRLVDAAQALAEASPDGIPGADLFYEHVHLRFEGNVLVARALLEGVGAELAAATGEAGTPPEPLARSVVAERLAYTDWDAERTATEVLGRLAMPPFTAQLDNAEQRASLRSEQQALAKRLEDGGLATARRAIEKATQPPDANLLLRTRHALFLLSHNEDLEEAVRQLRMVLDRIPQSSTEWILLGQAQGMLGHHDEALTSLRRALALNPHSAGFLTNLALGQQRAGRLREARRTLEEALAMDPFEEVAHFNMAGLLLSGKKVSPSEIAKAEEHYRAALEISPAYYEARHNLSRLYYRQAQAAVQAGAIQPGIMFLEKTLDTDPSYAFPHYNLGAIYLSNLQDAARAEIHFRAFLRMAGDAHPNERATAMKALVGMEEDSPKGEPGPHGTSPRDR